jgi:metal-responsive CopG/Arc/MetJ family transcriptional regulator
MKIALSIPDDLFRAGEALSKRAGVSRSRLYASALADFLAKHEGRSITERLNALYAEEESGLDRRVRRAQKRAVTGEGW